MHRDGPIAHLARLPEATLGSVVASHVVEHLHAQEVVELVAAAARSREEGGQLIIATLNPESLDVRARLVGLGSHPYRGLVHPSYLQVLARHAGFREVEVVLLAPPPADERLLDVPSDAPAAHIVNENVARLNQLLFADREVLVVATR